MTRIAIAGASSELAREILDALVATGKHEIVALIRKDPKQFPTLPGVEWIQTTYEDKSELVTLLKGVETVLCFFAVHLDPGNETQKRLIDASVEAGVKRYAPSEWATGVKLESALDVVPWYGGKVEVSQYLEGLNREKKVIEYTRFQPGFFLNYLGHPRKVSKYISTLPFLMDFEHGRALVVEGSLDDYNVYTTVADIATVVARAVEYPGEWPTVGGIRGSPVTIRELLHIGESILGKPFEIDWLKLEDLEKGELKTDNYTRVELPSIPDEQVEAFSKLATRGILIGMSRGLWDVSDEWNQALPDHKFTQVKEFLEGLWVEK